MDYWHQKQIIKNIFALNYLSFRALAVLVSVLFIVTLGQFRWLRSSDGGIEHVRYYDYFDNYAALSEIIKGANKPNPIRAGAIELPAVMLQSYGFETVDGHGAIFFRRYKEIFKEIILDQLTTQAAKDSYDNNWYDYLLRNNGPLCLPLLEMLNVRYLLSPSRITYLEAYGCSVVEIWPDRTKLLPRQYNDPLFLYELPNWFPRGYLVSRSVVLPSDNQILSEMRRHSSNDLRQMVFLKEGEFPKRVLSELNNCNDSQAQAAIIKYKPDYIVFKVKTKGPKILVISNNFHSKWEAYIDGIKTEVFRVNHALQGVFINKPGEFRVTLQYHDPLLWFSHAAIPVGVLFQLIGFSLCAPSNWRDSLRIRRRVKEDLPG
jgi:hypothetical protein